VVLRVKLKRNDVSDSGCHLIWGESETTGSDENAVCRLGANGDGSDDGEESRENAASGERHFAEVDCFSFI